MATKGIALREWSISRSSFTTEDEFRGAVAQELASFEHIGERLGIGLVSVPIRARRPDTSWYTAGWVFKTATVPAAKPDALPGDTTELPELEALAAESVAPEAVAAGVESF